MQHAPSSSTVPASPAELLAKSLLAVLAVQWAWCALAALWNVAGVVLIELGRPAPGPTASLVAAGFLLLLATGLGVAVRRWPMAYLVLSAIAGLMGAAAVVNALTANPSLWPSEFWRFAGIALNGIGTVASTIAVAAVMRWKFR